ncbi:MAG TPA: hypothetical protein VFC63_13165 [Blastocatellia bacterium]|nr:hypothetical protein [Blastocatellia bacterium]
MRIAINGIGVAGPALAWWLREYGYDPVMFELAPKLRSGGYLVDFWGVGYDIAERMGILPELYKRGYKMRELRLVDRRGKKSSGMNVEDIRSLTADRFVSVARSDIASTIYDACRDTEARFGIHVTGVDQHPDFVVVKLSDGSTEKFDLLIGADGLHSKVRSSVFGPDENYERSLGAYVSAFTLRDYLPRDELTYISCPRNRQAGVPRFIAR